MTTSNQPRRTVRFYLLRDTRTGLYDEGKRIDGQRICTGTQDSAEDYSDSEIEIMFPDGLPDGWEKEVTFEI